MGKNLEACFAAMLILRNRPVATVRLWSMMLDFRAAALIHASSRVQGSSRVVKYFRSKGSSISRAV